MLAVLAVGLVAGCQGETEPVAAPPDLSVPEAFAACVEGDPETGVAALDAAVGRDAGPDVLVTRGLCRWTVWGESDDPEDARLAYQDLTAAIEAVEAGAPSATPLDEIVSRRAFVARALDAAWVRTLEDLDRAVGLAPESPTHALDRAVVRRYAGDPTGARADLERFLDIADPDDSDRRALAQALLADLPAPPDTTAADTTGAALPTGP